MAFPQLLNSCDAVVHLAGRSIASRRWSISEKRRIRDSRVAATQRLAEQICQLDCPPRIFISASAIGIYGDQRQRQVDESSPVADDFLASVARQWEAACEPLAAVGIRVIHPRFGIILSQTGGALAQMLPIFRWGLAGRLGTGQQYWSWIALYDCIEALVWMIENQHASGPYNLVSPEAVTNHHFTRELAKAVRRPAVVRVPEFALRLALGEMAVPLLLSSCRAIPQRLQNEGFAFEFPTLARYLAHEFSGAGQI